MWKLQLSCISQKYIGIKRNQTNLVHLQCDIRCAFCHIRTNSHHLQECCNPFQRTSRTLDCCSIGHFGNKLTILPFLSILRRQNNHIFHQRRLHRVHKYHYLKRLPCNSVKIQRKTFQEKYTSSLTININFDCYLVFHKLLLRIQERICILQPQIR